VPATRQSSEPGAGKRGLWAWGLLAALVCLWELQAFFQHPRREHPTLSSLSNELLVSPTSRAIGLLAWLALGVWLARR
jgi:hypothetical protein